MIGKDERNLVKKGLLLYKSEIKELLILFLGKETIEQYSEDIDKVLDLYIEDKYYGEEYLDGNMNYDENRINNLVVKDVNKQTLEIIKINLKIVNNIIDNKETNIEVEEYILLSIDRIKNKYNKIFEDYFNAMQDENFIYCEGKLTDKLIDTSIKCSTKFNKIYSDYAIETSIKKKVISEKIDEIKLRMLSMKIFNNILKRENQQYKYIIYFNPLLYKRVKKLTSIFNLMNDPYSQNKILLAINYKTLIKEKDHILKYRQSGYKFVIEITDEDIINIDKDALLYCEYIFINTQNKDITEYYQYIPVNMVNKMYLTKDTILYEEMF